MAGSFIAPYEGKHGWYFKNKSNQDIEVSINLTGEYQLINNKNEKINRNDGIGYRNFNSSFL